QNTLRSINIHAFIRIDGDSMKASIIDIIRVMCPKAAPENAAHILTRFLEDENGPTRPTPISDRIDYMKINGKGNTTPVCDAKTLVEIIWLLPSRAAKEFRRQSAHTIARVLDGNTSLCDEIEQRCARLQSTEEGMACQKFLMDSAHLRRLVQKLPFGSIARWTKRRQLSSRSWPKAVAFEQIDMYDTIKDAQRRASGANNMIAAAPVDNSILYVARPVDDSIDPETGLVIATHKCTDSVRGPETSICNEVAKMGVKVGEKAGQVGKVVKGLYSEKYGVEASLKIPKRRTTFRAKPFPENSYWDRDADLIQQAIRI
ncbi:unnamed protein product, partial [Hapterophycus canaliculatus]